MSDTPGVLGQFIEITSHQSAEPIAVVFAAVLAAGIAVWAVLTNRRIARQAAETNRKDARDSATIELIHTTAWDTDFIAARKTFKRLRVSGGFEACINDQEGDDFADVMKMLNHYELIAIGIDEDILSSEIYQRYFRSRFVLDWLEVKPFVEALRRTHNKDGAEIVGKVLLNEYETLAETWSKKHGIRLTP